MLVHIHTLYWCTFAWMKYLLIRKSRWFPPICPRFVDRITGTVLVGATGTPWNESKCMNTGPDTMVIKRKLIDKKWHFFPSSWNHLDMKQNREGDKRQAANIQHKLLWAYGTLMIYKSIQTRQRNIPWFVQQEPQQHQ